MANKVIDEEHYKITYLIARPIIITKPKARRMRIVRCVNTLRTLMVPDLLVVCAGFGLVGALFLGVIAYFPEKPKKPPSLTSFMHERPSAISEDIKRLLR